jgi:Rab-GTPase-TBC domain
MDFIDLDEWKSLLNVPDTEYFSITTALDLPNQRVIKSDVERTRTSTFNDNERIQLELLLNYYCKEYNTSYKQGMNEIMAPFLLLSRQGLPLHMVYLFFKSFVHTYLPTMFIDHAFRPLQAMFKLFKLLLRYHEPYLSSYFLHYNISPEFFGTPWFLTIYAGKINDMKVLYTLWQEIIQEKDILFPLFIGIGILQHFKDIIIRDHDTVLQVLSNIVLDDIIHSVLEKSRALKENMPYSMLMQLSKYDVYNLDTVDLLIKSLEKDVCLSVLPREILHRAYPEYGLYKWGSSVINRIPIMVIDCRTTSEQNAGKLPNSLMLSSEAYKDTETMMSFPDQLVTMRGLYHFCFMGSKPFKSTNFDLSVLSSDQTDIVQNMIENLLQAFLAKAFPYLSVLEGGFERCHDFADHYKIQIEEHSTLHCLPCNPKGTKARKASEDLNDLKASEKELKQGKETKAAFIFVCKKYEGYTPSNIVYELKINTEWFEATPINTISTNIKLKISSLTNITIMKKNPKILSFRFKDFGEILDFCMESSTEAKKCVSQVSKFYQMLLN